MADKKPGDFVIPFVFGKQYGSKTIDDIAKSNKGLLWLDRLRGRARSPWLRKALAEYLDDPAIARDLKELLDR